MMVPFCMEMMILYGVIYAGLGIAAATGLGSVLGLILDRLPGRVYDMICGLAGGIMLYAAIVGLIVPAGELGSSAVVCAGVLLGALFLERMNGWLGAYLPNEQETVECRRGLLLVLAIVVHHFPEGMAAGVSFGTGDAADTLAVCTGIALQNIPEAMVIVPSMRLSGAGWTATGGAVVCSGFVEILGLCLGYGLVSAAGLLPFLLSFAGGTMLFVVLGSMVTEDVYAVLLGFCGMILI